MKRTLTFFACVAICCVMAVSCKNAKTAEPTQEEVQAQKVALADSILVIIDEIVENDAKLYGQQHNPLLCVLTDEEKLVKPDYLFDHDKINQLVTKEQKANALGILIADYSIRLAYEMPLDETKAAMGRLAAELNIPFNTDEINGEKLSDKLRNTYEQMKENGDVELYWKIQRAIYVSSNYFISRNPELFFGKVSADVWDTFRRRSRCLAAAVVAIASVDASFAPESTVAKYKKLMDKSYSSSLNDVKEYYINDADSLEARYNALLQ